MAGVIIGNRYELMEKIGSGGMAIVYKARCRLLNRFVAVKMLRPEFNDDVEFLKRFETEAQAAAALSHPNIVSVYDVGTHDRIHYIVMEYVEGHTLKEFLNETGPLPIEKIVDFSTQIASALEHAHAKQIIHHDIKPHNIIITESGLLKVTDFGLARAVSASTTVAAAGAIGSVHYASPEQARGGFTDAKSDIYSLGITMYEMTTGRVPFDGDTPVAIAIKHLQKEPAPPSEIAPDVPQSLEKIILKCIEKEPSKRYQSAGEIIEDLKGVLNNDGVVHKNEGDEEKFSTRRMPSAEDIKKEEERRAAQQQNQPEQEPIPEPGEDIYESSGGKKKKEDIVAVVAAIATTLLIAAVIGIILFRPGGPLEGFGGFTSCSKPQAEQVVLPDFVGMTIEEAEEKAQKSELELQIEYRDSEDGEEGVILGQDPEYDESAIIKIDKGSTVTVYVSKLPGDDDEKIKIPDYTGKDYEDVRERLIKLGFDKNNISIIRQEDEDIDEDCVIKTFPGSGSEVPRDSEIKIYVSKGKENDIAVPYLVGSTVDGARQLLSSEGLKGGRVDYRESDKPEGTVIEQDPVSGTKVNKGFSVNLVVSSGKETEPTPTPSQVPTPTQEPEEQDTTEQNNTEASEPKTSGDSSSAGESQSTVELGE